MHAVEERYDTSGLTDSDEFTETFHNLKVSSKCLYAVSTRREAFTTIEVQCPQKRRKEGNLFWQVYIYKMKYSTILSALETITKTAMRSLS